MSHEITPPAYRTRLGNPTAKSILALIADQVNVEGYGYPSVHYIAEKTEINLRTVLRVIQVFVEIGLLAKVDRGPKKCFGIQLEVSKLGQDLREEFGAAYVRAQRKDKAVPQLAVVCAGDVAETPESDVAATGESVAATGKSVAATVPPNPHIGVPVSVPLTSLPPLPPEGAPADGLTQEQREHLEKLAGTDPERCKRMRSYYLESNAHAEVEGRRLLEEERKLHEREQAMRALMPDAAAARAWLMQQCGFVDSDRRRSLGGLLEEILQQEAELGNALWVTAPLMAERWRLFVVSGDQVEVHWTPVKFFKFGYWRDTRGWAWKRKGA